MINLLNTLNKISKLDLSSYPEEDLTKYMSQIGMTAQIGYTLHKGFSILRARPNSTDSEVFNHRNQLSYKPQTFNTTFQRASTPNKTMFYGSILPTEFGKNDFNISRISAMFEASNTYRNNLFKSNEKITIGRWEVKEDINLMVILPVSEDDASDSFVGYMNAELKRILQSDKQLATRTRLINQFFGYQFGNPNIRFDYDYLLTALYTEMVLKMGFDGIIYPSVKAQGKGYNVCITPEAVDKKLSLVAAGEGRIIKIGYISDVVGETECLISDDSKPFVFSKMANYRDPKEIIEEIINAYK